jgi:hypothetical protein
LTKQTAPEQDRDRQASADQIVVAEVLMAHFAGDGDAIKPLEEAEAAAVAVKILRALGQPSKASRYTRRGDPGGEGAGAQSQ